MTPSPIAILGRTLGRHLRWLPWLAVAVAPAAAAETFIWSSPTLGAALTELPAPWTVEDHSENSVVLTRDFATNVLAFKERMTFQIARDTSAGLGDTLETLRSEGYCLVRQRRVGNSEMSAPFWLLSGPADDESSCWIGVLLHAGKVYTLTLQYSALDSDAPGDFDRVLGGFRLLEDPREAGWSAYTRGDYEAAERSFKQILRIDRDDANARYGLGLAELARHDLESATDDLARAEPSLRGVEDVRRALGRAEFERGNIARAVALWVQVLNDEPGWENEVGPWIDAAIRSAAAHGDHLHPTPETSGASRRLPVIAERFLASLRHGDTWTFFALQAEFEHTRDALLTASLAGRGSPLDLAVLHASCSWDRGIRQGMAAAHDGDESRINDAQYLLAQPFHDLCLQP